MGISGTDTLTVELRLEMMTLEEAALIGELFRLLPQITRLRSAEREVQAELWERVQAGAEGTMVRLRDELAGTRLWDSFARMLASPAARPRFGGGGRTRSPSLEFVTRALVCID